MTTVAEIVAFFDSCYPPATAESWDAVGLVVGDPQAEVRRVLFAVDPVEATVRQALDGGYDLLVTHHPLYLRGTTTVAASTPKGRLVHDLITGGCGLFVAHTNADVASPGVSDALAAAVGLFEVAPMQAGELTLGRVGRLPEPMTVRALVDRIAAALPATTAGVRASGDPDAVVHRLAVSAGAGDSLLREAASVADAFLTADLRHHPASEAPPGLVLIDAAHWATEWPWLQDAADRLRAATTVDTHVSVIDTDPWTYCSRSPQA